MHEESETFHVFNACKPFSDNRLHPLLQTTGTTARRDGSVRGLESRLSEKVWTT